MKIFFINRLLYKNKTFFSYYFHLKFSFISVSVLAKFLFLIQSFDFQNKSFFIKNITFLSFFHSSLYFSSFLWQQIPFTLILSLTQCLPNTSAVGQVKFYIPYIIFLISLIFQSFNDFQILQLFCLPQYRFFSYILPLSKIIRSNFSLY
ncbi:hypothetical protein IMG5_172880 [Ichthyophthirius multifiliis]|uniref:Transmembrane protein n=1 Tax=Ichthyophthirius multifiliis TaxID=5932 RepID=G0R1U3_ICHMU|nr:hypothetical protein IMG5_172880 [Ichthyophthirius multifiliis]EGR28552.1 hypothetical protein IMG5_172880 [Ichthyophthirius multifiliis]|eukprot:XP_004029788.1 hypothetical protein IMG5_172880 [Ichthyophthirius multifiliis]